MTSRGDRTKALLIRATTDLVGDVGYHRTTTRAIAVAAGVSEGTIYRHFPDKRALFFAAVLAGHQPVLDWMAALPARAGEASVRTTLTEALVQLAQLQEAVLPLELAMATDPELVRQRAGAAVPAAPPPDGPPARLTDYLAAEQRLGRVDPDLDPSAVALVLLATLFGLAVNPLAPPGPVAEASIRSAVDLLVDGISPRAAREP